MKVLLLHDVYKLGHAGDVKKVADGYGRNYLLPQGLAVLGTPSAVKMAAGIKAKADVVRAQVSTEMTAVSERINGTWITFPSKAGETGKLYGSITPQMVADAISEKAGIKIEKHQLDVQPIKTLGEHKAGVRLTIDIVPTVKIMVYREGETPVLGDTEEKPADEAVAETEEKPAEEAEKKSEKSDEKPAEKPEEK